MPCGITGLCGISSRFRLLSPCTGQVTHALLTRPPLSNMVRHPERIRSVLFVRLACVRHAASVHPEPGSTSHIMVFFLNRIYLLQVSLRWHNFASLSDSLRIMILLESCEVCQFESYDSYWLSPEISFIILMNFQGCLVIQFPRFCVCCPLVCFVLPLAATKFIIPNVSLLVNTFFYFFST